MISVERLCKAFGKVRAVDGVDFAVAPGEVLGLLGPNGAGKTTTIKMLVGALRPDSGSIDIDGAGDPAQAEVRRRIGLAPQSISLYGELTGLENLAFFARLYGLRGRHLSERVEWALELAGLTERGDDRVRTYSGGMQRRLNLACALVHDPRALLLDEPAVGVDPQSRNRLFEIVEQQKRRGRTILYTTHYMEEAQRLCDRVAIMDGGRLLAVDAVPSLILKYGGDAVVTAELDPSSTNHSGLPGRLEGTRLRFQTPSPLDEVGRLSARGVRFTSLNIERPNLEYVFLHLTGKKLRD